MNQPPIDMNDVAQHIAPHLRDWTPETNGNDLVGILRRPDGAGIYLRPTRPGCSNNRIEVSGDYPPKHYPPGIRFAISISSKRTPQEMAHDIQRRFLPEYDRLYAACWAESEDERRRWQEKIETTQRIAGLLGVRFQPPADRDKVCELSWSEDDFYAYVRTDNGRVYLNRVSMSLAQFEGMVATIRNPHLTTAALNLLIALETVVEFAHAALEGTIHQDNLEYFENIAYIAIEAARKQ